MELDLLLVLERERVLEVLRRDKLLRTMEEERIRRMKSDLQELRRKGAKSYGRQYGERTCARCQRALGRLWNCGAVCRGCSHRICSKCRVSRASVGWKCTVCHAYREVKVRSGEWFLEERAKKFPVTAGKYQTVGDRLLTSLSALSQISVVPPTPPPHQSYVCCSIFSRPRDLKESKPFARSMEDMMVAFTGNLRKLSTSQSDVHKDYLQVQCDLGCKSRSDTHINESRVFKRPSLPNLSMGQSNADASSIGTEEDESVCSNCSGEKRGSSSSIGTTCSLPEGVAVSGELQLALAFSSTSSCLEIWVGGCRDLCLRDGEKTFVKLHVLPDKRHKLKTAKKNAADPVFNQVFQIHIERHLLIGKRLQATVWQSHVLTRNVFLGEVLLPLDGWMLDDNMSQNPTWYPLSPKQYDGPVGGAVEPEDTLKFRCGGPGELLQLSSLKVLREKDAHHKI